MLPGARLDPRAPLRAGVHPSRGQGHVISLRKANRREAKRHEAALQTELAPPRGEASEP